MIVGVDTGGTFTDFVVLGPGAESRVHKVPSTPEDPARAVLSGLRDLLGVVADRDAADRDDAPPARLVHGSTVATNALLERKGARVVLLTTEGFEDVIEIGRQARRSIYDLSVGRPPPLVPRERRLGVRERLNAAGEPVIELTDEEAERAVAAAFDSEPEAVAICLLHSYAEPGHEHRLAEALRAAEPAPFVTASHEVLPEFREYERAVTTAVNAYVGPVMSRYLGEVGDALPGRVRIMQSNGGVIPLEAASRFAVQTILSGPAGGAVGGFEIARQAGYEDVITFDMGGTSTDVSLCAGALTRTSEATVGELPIRTPTIDIHTVGAGGGSVAWRDPGGSLRVGPESAGADPGPICYGLGGERVTVTDANLFLGRLPADRFLGGARQLDVAAARAGLGRLADALGLDPLEAAEGVVRVANATMERAIRVVSLERGHDPRDFTLVCFGGAGGLHAADLALALGIPRVLVPRAAGALSALGMLLAEPIRDFSRTLLARAGERSAPALGREFEALEALARESFAAEGHDAGTLRLERALDMRYVGQGYELSVPFAADYERAFHAAHERRYGYADPGRPSEIVNARLRATAPVEPPRLPEAEQATNADPGAAVLGPHRFVWEGEEREGPLIDRERLRVGHAFDGPAVVAEYSTTTVIPPGATCRVDRLGDLVLEWP